MSIPQELRYTKEHEWVRFEAGEDGAGTATVGITAFAAESLGDVVFVQLPEPGQTVVSGESCGEIESTKSVSELYVPVDGEVIEFNNAVVDTPELINSDPFGEGWLFRMRTTEPGDLLDAAAYAAVIKED